MGKAFLHTVLIAIIALSLTACTPAAKPARKKAPNATRILLDKGRYEEVARRMSSGNWRKYASESERVHVYSGAINGLIDMGDSAANKNAYGEAGVSYRKALDYYPSEAAIAKKVRLPKEKLLVNIGNSSNMLMEAGLLKYRAGQLEEAIATWNRIILFDPKNAEAGKALETATIQLENLRKLK